MAAGLRSLGTWTSTLRGRDQYRRVSNEGKLSNEQHSYLVGTYKIWRRESLLDFLHGYTGANMRQLRRCKRKHIAFLGDATGGQSGKKPVPRTDCSSSASRPSSDAANRFNAIGVYCRTDPCHNKARVSARAWK